MKRQISFNAALVIVFLISVVLAVGIVAIAATTNSALATVSALILGYGLAWYAGCCWLGSRVRLHAD